MTKTKTSGNRPAYFLVFILLLAIGVFALNVVTSNQVAHDHRRPPSAGPEHFTPGPSLRAGFEGYEAFKLENGNAIFVAHVKRPLIFNYSQNRFVQITASRAGLRREKDGWYCANQKLSDDEAGHAAEFVKQTSKHAGDASSHSVARVFSREDELGTNPTSRNTVPAGQDAAFERPSSAEPPKATLLDGRVFSCGSGGAVGTYDASIYNPLSKKRTDVGPMLEPRTQHGLIVLGDGSVLVYGGKHSLDVEHPKETKALATTEIFRP